MRIKGVDMLKPFAHVHHATGNGARNDRQHILRIALGST
jgi:hypothetical protein